MPYQTKTFSDYNLPTQYSIVIQGYYDDVSSILGNDLLMFMLTSSCALGACIDGWSDIDILVVVDRLRFEDLKAMHEAQSKYDIKIALAALSRYELETGAYDDKTRVVFYQTNTGLMLPNYIINDPTFVLPHIELQDIQEDDVHSLPGYLHKMRRLLYAPSPDKYTIIKTLIVVAKKLLRSKGHEIMPNSYTDVFQKFAIEFNEDYFDILSERISGQPASEEFIAFARRIIERICNGEFNHLKSTS